MIGTSSRRPSAVTRRHSSTWFACMATACFAIARRILRDVDRAEDALQDALVIAWRDVPSLRDPDRFGAWLHRVLTNVCIGQATRERGRLARLRVLPTEGTVAPDDFLSVVDRDDSTAHSGASRPTSARCSSCTTSWAIPRPRSPNCSACRRNGPLATSSRTPCHASRARCGNTHRGRRSVMT